MYTIRDLKLEIAASLFYLPTTEKELMEREFLKNKSTEGVQRLIMSLEKDALYYIGDVMYIRKKWAKENLKEYDLDFRTPKEKYLDSLTPFARDVLKQKGSL
jgi:hypothetical protein